MNSTIHCLLLNMHEKFHPRQCYPFPFCKVDDSLAHARESTYWQPTLFQRESGNLHAEFDSLKVKF